MSKKIRRSLNRPLAPRKVPNNDCNGIVRHRISRVAPAFVEQLESRKLLSNAYLLDGIPSFGATNGRAPYSAPVFDASGNLFGTTSAGGSNGVGTVFEIAHGTNTLNTVASFDNTNGASPHAGLTLDGNGNLFGTTSYGGAGGVGTVFEIVHGTAAITTIASFNISLTGAFTQAGLTLDSSGNLFGTTLDGGAGGYGTVFEIVHGSNAITTLASFNNTNGANPNAGVTLDSGGNLYGTTTNGGAGGYGTIFEIVHGSTTIINLASFNNTNGAHSYAGLSLDSVGDLFGTTASGGSGDYGTVFEIAQGTNVISTVASFNDRNGDSPYAGVTLDSNGNLFGTTLHGGATHSGAVFEIVHGTTSITLLDSFNYTNGANPSADLTLDSAGNLFGTTYTDGGGGYGTVFEIVHGTTAITTVALINDINGSNPQGRLTPDASGNLFGTTYHGGPGGYGTVFEIIRGTTAITTLASFNRANGADPGDVTLDSDGNLFGTTAEGGPGGYGTVFEIIHGTDSITTVASFNSANGAYANRDLIIDASGNLLGTTFQLGSNFGTGTVFEVAHGTNVITTIARFNGTSGRGPTSGLTLDSSGNLFGTTLHGGTADAGVVFEIIHGTTAITPIASFDSVNGDSPQGSGVTFDSSGNLFGTTYQGGTSNDGTIFEISHDTNTITTLASFNGDNGAFPEAGVTLDSSGNLFGTTFQGGLGGCGTVFEVVRGTNVITTLASFNGYSGAFPQGGVTLDSSGNIYGTTSGGSSDGGTIFQLSPLPPTLLFTALPTSTAAGSPIDGKTGVQIGLLYPWGNLYTGDFSTVTLTLTGGTFADGSRTANAPAVGGVATFTNLVINTAGNYSLTATDSGLANTAAASFTVADIAVTATVRRDSIFLRKNADGIHIDEWLNSSTPGDGAPTLQCLLTGASSLTIDGAGGSDQITIDQGNGNLFLATNTIADAGGSASVKIVGTSSDDTLSLDGATNTLTWSTGSAAKVVTLSGVTSVEYQDLGGNDNVGVAGGIPLTLDMGPDSDTLNVAAGANAVVNFGSSSGELTINGNGNTSLVFGTGDPTFHFVATPANPPVNPKPAKGAITGTVFNDANGDGKREAADKPLAGRKLYIDSNHNGKPDAGEPTAVTDATGAYHFAGLAAGTYRVREVLPAGYRASSPSMGYLDVDVANGKTATGKNFGQTREAQISGVVFRDANRDGQRETSEAGLAGWIVYLDLNHDGKLDTGDISVKTDASGRYTFLVPAGKYVVREVVKSGFARTTPSTGNYAITLSGGQSATAKNFGNR